MFDAIIVMKRDTFQEIVPSRKRETNLMFLKTMIPTNKIFKREKDDSDEEYVLISTLMVTISHGINDWIEYIGTSKHVTRYKE